MPCSVKIIKKLRASISIENVAEDNASFQDSISEEGSPTPTINKKKAADNFGVAKSEFYGAA